MRDLFSQAGLFWLSIPGMVLKLLTHQGQKLLNACTTSVEPKEKQTSKQKHTENYRVVQRWLQRSSPGPASEPGTAHGGCTIECRWTEVAFITAASQRRFLFLCSPGSSPRFLKEHTHVPFRLFRTSSQVFMFTNNSLSPSEKYRSKYSFE